MGCNRYTEQRIISCDVKHVLLAIGGITQARADVVFGQVGEIGEDFRDRHTGSQAGEDIILVILMPRMQDFPARLPGSSVRMSR